MEALPCPKLWRSPDGTPRQDAVPTGTPCTAAIDGETGLLLPTKATSRKAAYVLVGVGAALAVLSGLLVTGSAVIGVVGGVVLGLLGVLLIAAGLFALRKRPAATGFVLTPTAVVLTWSRPVVRLPWDGITEVRPLSLRLGRAPESASRNYIGLCTRERLAVGERMTKLARRFGPDVACAVPVASVNVDQLVVLHTLAYYRDHPEARAELAGEDAVVRVQESRLR
ncbi:hypothetical protein ACTG9Q_06500 [Actinokineospora sp. 24-640]